MARLWRDYYGHLAEQWGPRVTTRSWAPNLPGGDSRGEAVTRDRHQKEPNRAGSDGQAGEMTYTPPGPRAVKSPEEDRRRDALRRWKYRKKFPAHVEKESNVAVDLAYLKVAYWRVARGLLFSSATGRGRENALHEMK